MTYSFKKLTQDQLARIQELEGKLNCCIIAFDQLPEPATLSAQQLEALGKIEKETDAVLVAYKCK